MRIHDITHPIYYAIVPQGAVITPRAHGIDLSKHDKGFDPATTDKQLDFVFQRASYGVTRDEAFDTIWQGVQKMPIRMAYHYLSSHIGYKAQADAFLSYVRDYPFHAVVCDFEGAFNDLTTGFAKTAWDWMTYVEQKTGMPVILYTSLSLYNSYIAPSEAIYKIDWDRFAYWQAQWFLTPNPNGTPTMPTKRTGGWRFWQYTDKGSGYGTVRNYPTDLDVYNGSVSELRKYLGLGTEPTPPTNDDVETKPFAGVTNVRGERGGWKFSLWICDPGKVRYQVVHPVPRTIGTEIARQTGAQIVINGGEWDRVTGVPKDYSVSNGQVYIPRKEFVPSFMIMNDDSLRIYHESEPNVKHAISGLRYLVVNRTNVIPPDGTEPKYTEGHSRHVDGLNADGFGMHLTSEGAYPNQGLRLFEAAELMRQYGAVTAFDEGGGGDMTEVVQGVLMNKPEDISNGTNVQRALPQFLAIYAEENSMANGTAKEILGNTGTIRKSPSRYGTDTGKRVQPGATVEFVKVVPVTVLGSADNPADQWFELTDGNYLNYILSSKKYFLIVMEPTPPSGGVTISGVRYSGEVVFDYSDGTQEVWHISDAPLTKGPAQ